jgi:hypothetical protein
MTTPEDAVNVPITVRIPRPLRDQLADIAARERRTLSAQAQVYIERGVQADSGT